MGTKRAAHCSILFSELECTLYTSWNVAIKIFRCSQMHFIVIQNTRRRSVLSIWGGLVCTSAWSRHPKYAVLHHKSNQWYEQWCWRDWSGQFAAIVIWSKYVYRKASSLGPPLIWGLWPQVVAQGHRPEKLGKSYGSRPSPIVKYKRCFHLDGRRLAFEW
jgi:hypothetical protein